MKNSFFQATETFVRVYAIQTWRKRLLVGKSRTVLLKPSQKSELFLPVKIKVAVVLVLAAFGEGRGLVVGFP